MNVTGTKTMENFIYKLFWTLIFCVLTLLIMYFFPESISWTIHNRFDLDAEANIPAWFSSVILLFVSLSSLGIYVLDKINRSQQESKSFWLIFCLVYCFLSMDETAQIHEAIGRTLHIKWVYIYAPFAALFFLTCLYFIVVIYRNKTLMLWVIGGLIIYALGGLIGELVEYLYYKTEIFKYFSKIEIILEEGFEMLGTIFVLKGCMIELNKHFQIYCNNKPILK